MAAKESSDIVQALAFMVITGGTLIVHAFKRLRLARKVEDTPTAPISSAPQGTVEFQGYAWPVEAMTSPLTQKNCVYYWLIIEEERRSKNNSSWVKVFESQSDRPFAIADKTGYAIIFPQGAETNIDSVTITNPTETQLSAIETLLSKAGSSVKVRSGLFTSKKRYKEHVIQCGSPLYVLGTFKTVAGFRPYALHPGCDSFFSKITAFNPGVGMAQGKNVDLKEAAQAFIALADQCGGWQTQSMAMASGMTTTAPTRTVSNTQPYTESSGFLTHTQEAPLFFANAKQNELLQRLGSFNWIKIVAGAALIAAAASLFISKYHSKF